MTNYRRSNIPGASYFFTVNLADRSSRLLTDHVALLRNAFEYTRNRHPFTIDAIVILPDHLHAIWTLPAGDSNFALRWRLIKPCSHVACRAANIALQAVKARTNVAYGNGDIGNI